MKGIIYMKEKLLFKHLAGSFLYGTNSESSDKDYKGVFLPDLNDLILGKAPKHYTSSTGAHWERNTADDIDETYYSLHYFLELAAKGDTNAIDMLFAYTNEDAVIYIDPIFQEIIDNLDKILTKNVNAYLGYCIGQAKKYSIKGDKLKNYNAFKSFCDKYYLEKDTNGASITLLEALEFEFNTHEFPKLISNCIPEPGAERNKIAFGETAKFNFGDHCYMETAMNKESFITISDVKFQINDTVKTAYKKVEKVISSYGKRAEATANDNGVDWKAISHCVRVLYQVEELLTTNKITFPLVNADFVKSIKYNTANMSYDEVMKLIEEKINRINNRLLPNSTLREKADYKWIEQFILKCYGSLIINNIEDPNIQNIKRQFENK
jgi:predicted nucleotidyltransferase